MCPCPMDASRQPTVPIGTSTTGVPKSDSSPSVMSRVEPTNCPNTYPACKLKLTPATTTLIQPVSGACATNPWYCPPHVPGRTQVVSTSSVKSVTASSSNGSMNHPEVSLKTFSSQWIDEPPRGLAEDILIKAL